MHPFSDGNGRGARVLASVYLLRAVSVPLVVFADQRALNLRALSETDSGDPEAFVDFVAERAVDTILLLAEALRSASPPSVDQSMSRINEAATSRRQVTMAEVGSTGLRLIEQVRATLRSSIERIPGTVAARVSENSRRGTMPTSYRHFPYANPTRPQASCSR